MYKVIELFFWYLHAINSVVSLDTVGARSFIGLYYICNNCLFSVYSEDYDYCSDNVVMYRIKILIFLNIDLLITVEILYTNRDLWEKNKSTKALCNSLCYTCTRKIKLTLYLVPTVLEPRKSGGAK